MRLDPDEDPDAVYRTLTSLVIPRPIGWISTVDEDGNENLAPFSYFNAVSDRPPTVMFSAGDLDDGLKDTPRNALETEEFVANLATRDLVESVDKTSAYVDENEFDVAGLERTPAETVAPPRVASARAAMECEVSESLRIGRHTVVFGEVTLFHVDDSLTTDDDGTQKVEGAAVDAVGRCGGPYYTGIDLLDFTRTY